MTTAMGLLTAALLSASPGGWRASTSEIPEWARAGDPTEPICEPGSEPAREAGAALRRLDLVLRDLKPGEPIRPFQEAFAALGKLHCFQGVTEIDFSFDDPSVAVEQAQEWWRAGGEHWLRSLLEFGGLVRRVVVPPDLRNRLGPGSSRLMKLLSCDPKSGGCATGDAWRRRAATALSSVKTACDGATSDCLAFSDGIYGAWRDCVDSATGRSIELPLGAFNPPTTGWLTIHRTMPLTQSPAAEDEIETCATVDVYSLTRGDVWSLDGCRGSAQSVGRVAVMPLRELALLLLVEDQIQEDVRIQSHEVALPDGFNQGLGHYGLTQCRGGRVAFLDGRTFTWQVQIGAHSKRAHHDALALCETITAVSRDWQRELERQRQPICPDPVRTAEIDRATRALPRSSEAERQDLERLRSLMRRSAAECSAIAR